MNDKPEVIQEIEAREAEIQNEGLRELLAIRDSLKTYGEDEIDVRLHIFPSGTEWEIKEGDASFDHYHPGFWAAGNVAASDDAASLTYQIRYLYDEALEDAYQALA